MRLFVSRLFQYYSVINSERTRPGLNRRKLQIPGPVRGGEKKSAGKLHRSCIGQRYIRTTYLTEFFPGACLSFRLKDGDIVTFR